MGVSRLLAGVYIDKDAKGKHEVQAQGVAQLAFAQQEREKTEPYCYKYDRQGHTILTCPGCNQDKKLKPKLTHPKTTNRMPGKPGKTSLKPPKYGNKIKRKFKKIERVYFPQKGEQDDNFCTSRKTYSTQGNDGST